MFEKKTGVIAIFANLLVMFWVTAAQAYVGLCCAHCGGNMPLNIFGGGIPEPHEFRFKISQMQMEMGTLRDGTDDIMASSLVGPPNGTTFAAVPKSMSMAMTMVGGAYSFSDDFAVMAMASYIRNEMDMSIFRNVGSDFTMTSDGIGDFTVLGKYRVYKDDNLVPTKQVSVLFGLSLPSGAIDRHFTKNTVAGQNGTILPFKMQLGSGTVDPIIGVTYQGSRDPWWWGVNTQLEAHVYENEQGYRRGHELRYDFYVMRQVHDKVVLHTQLNGWYEGTYNREPYNGRVLGNGHQNGDRTNNNFLSPLFDPQNYGGHKLAVSVGAQFQPIPLHIIELTGTIPIHQDLNGPQLQDAYMLRLSYYVEVPTKRSRRYKGFSAPKELGF
ncbi:MAG: transporter [Nitrospinota bacterium]